MGRSGPREERVEIGYVARAHGVRGELRVVTHDPDSTALSDARRVFIGGTWFEIERARPTKGAMLVVLRGVADRDRAEELRGCAVDALRDELDLEDGDVLLGDLVDCEVVLEGGEPWGRIVAVEQGFQDRLVIHDGDVERLLPLVDEFLMDIDLDAARVVVSPPEGLPEHPIRPRSRRDKP